MFWRRQSTVGIKDTSADTKRYKKDADRRFVKRMALQANDDGSVFVGFRRAYILPTQKGLFYLVTLAVMFVWSVNYALSLGYAMTFFVGVLALLVSVLTVNNLTNIRVTITQQNNFFAGEPAFFYVDVHNNKQDPAIRLMARRNGFFSAPITLLSGQRGVLEIPVDDNRRGRKQLDYFRLSTDYPIGIFRSWTWLHMPASLVIYPMPKGDLPLPFLPEHQGIDEGQVDLHGAEDFHDLKDYQAGDNIRHIVWKKLSRGHVRVKSFQDLAGQECILDFNDDALRSLSVEEKLSQLCQWVLRAEKQGTKYAVRLPTQHIDFGIGAAHQAHCLEALACY